MRTKKFLLSVIIILISLVGYVSARQIGEFSHFRVSRGGNTTEYLLKEGASDSPYILNLRPSRNFRPIRIKNMLLNTRWDKRSDEHILECGERGEFSNWGSKGYSYCMKMSRENWWDGDIFIVGSWSPDK